MSDGNSEVPGEPKLNVSTELPGEDTATGGASLQQSAQVAQAAIRVQAGSADTPAERREVKPREVLSKSSEASVADANTKETGSSKRDTNSAELAGADPGNVDLGSDDRGTDDLDSDDAERDDAERDDAEVDEAGDVLPHVVEPEQDDPLGEAYDLELGSKLSRGAEPVVPWRSDVQTAKEFFNTEILYRYDILTDDEQKLISGTYRIELRGQNGGVWTVNIGDQLEVVNRREDADIVMAMAQRDFLHLVNGSLNPQLALLSQKMRITGDMRRGVAFQSILTPAGD